MKIRYISILVAVVLMMPMVTGCDTLKDKFVRKKEEPKYKTRQYYAVKEYHIKPSLELYTKRYVFWRNWHKELLDVLGDPNRKKAIVAIEQEISNLIDMRRMLVDEKAEQLTGLIDQLSEVEVIIKKRGMAGGNEVRIRKKIEHIGRKIKLNFSYRKIRGYIRNDFIR